MWSVYFQYGNNKFPQYEISCTKLNWGCGAHLLRGKQLNFLIMREKWRRAFLRGQNIPPFPPFVTLYRTRWIRAVPRTRNCGFLSAAQPTDQREESVVLLLVVVVGGGTIFQFPMYSFLGCERQNFVSKGVWQYKNIVSKGVWKGKNFVSNGELKGKHFVTKWLCKGKTLS